jgi:glucokinase
MPAKTHIGIDLGGTNVRAGIVQGNSLQRIVTRSLDATVSAEAVLQQLFAITDELINESVVSIGIGVPGLVDDTEALVYDVVNIPSWKKVPLQQWMQDRYKLPVIANNDANCFALGEYYFGKGRGCQSMVGLTIGTGLGSGLILNKKLYAGRNGGAGEFGVMDYLDHYYEYYASGQFFQNVYHINGETVFALAERGDDNALRMYDLFGMHLGNAVKAMLYALDVEKIILGGSVRHAFKFFEKSMRQQLESFIYTKALQHLQIEVSELENSGVLGAAALYDDRNKN